MRPSTSNELLPSLLGSTTRAKIIAIFFGENSRSLYLGEIVRFTGLASRSIEVELKRLRHLGLLQSLLDGNRIYYSADQSHPIYSDLRSICRKTAHVADRLTEALALSEVELAYLSTPTTTPTSDPTLDLIVVRQPSQRDLNSLIEQARKNAGGPPLRVQILTKQEFQAKLPAPSGAGSEKQFVIGREETLQAALETTTS